LDDRPQGSPHTPTSPGGLDELAPFSTSVVLAENRKKLTRLLSEQRTIYHGEFVMPNDPKFLVGKFVGPDERAIEMLANEFDCILQVNKPRLVSVIYL
jgi:hypothetical protein